MAGPAAAPGVFRLLALEIPRDNVADRRAKDIVVWDTEGSEEGDLADQDGVIEAAGGRGSAGGDVELEREAKTIIDPHGSDREIGLIVGVAAGPIMAHGDPTREVARLEAAVHTGASRVQNVKLAGRRIAFGAEHLVAAPADDQERVASAVAIDGHEIVAERPNKAGGGLGDWLRIGDLLIQVDVF